MGEARTYYKRIVQQSPNACKNCQQGDTTSTHKRDKKLLWSILSPFLCIKSQRYSIFGGWAQGHKRRDHQARNSGTKEPSDGADQNRLSKQAVSSCRWTRAVTL